MPPIEANEVYLGDGLYASFDGWQVELYASNGVEKSSRVWLEPDVLKAFERYISRLNQERGTP